MDLNESLENYNANTLHNIAMTNIESNEQLQQILHTAAEEAKRGGFEIKAELLREDVIEQLKKRRLHVEKKVEYIVRWKQQQ